MLRQEHWDAATAERFPQRLLAVVNGVPPDRITTNKLGSYAAAIARVPEPQRTGHLQMRSAMCCNNHVEPAHQPTRLRERVMRRFRSAAPAQRFLDAFTRGASLLRLGPHLLTAAAYRAAAGERVATWRAVTGLRAA
jgi:putative transposase